MMEHEGKWTLIGNVLHIHLLRHTDFQAGFHHSFMMDHDGKLTLIRNARKMFTSIFILEFSAFNSFTIFLCLY